MGFQETYFFKDSGNVEREKNTPEIINKGLVTTGRRFCVTGNRVDTTRIINPTPKENVAERKRINILKLMLLNII